MPKEGTVTGPKPVILLSCIEPVIHVDSFPHGVSSDFMEILITII